MPQVRILSPRLQSQRIPNSLAPTRCHTATGFLLPIPKQASDDHARFLQLRSEIIMIFGRDAVNSTFLPLHLTESMAKKLN